MAKKMTMADIANLSGVGKSTVSRYFNGGYVKDETRAKIQKVIEEYNYTPNAFARLNAKQSNVIGVVVPTLNSKITSRVITSIDRYLREKGYTTLIQNSDHDIDQELQNIQRLIQLNVDGILISSIAITKDHKELLKKAGIPVVVLTQDYEDGISIIYDDYHAGKTLDPNCLVCLIDTNISNLLMSFLPDILSDRFPCMIIIINNGNSIFIILC